MSIALPSSADLIARRLAAAGCRYAFGIPGGEVLTIMDALERAGIGVVLAKHENCAGFMGEGVHHRDLAPAILLATIGPGIANAVNVIANAFQDRVPMVVLTGCVSPGELHSYTHQVFDHVKLVEPVAKAAYRVEDGMAAILADKAVAIATEGRPGPVLLDIPIDVQTREQPAASPVPGAAAAPTAPARGAALDTARAWLAEARRPLMIAGLDVLTQRAEAAVAAFCHRFRVPLITTYKAKGVLSEDDPLALGAAGLSPTGRHAASASGGSIGLYRPCRIRSDRDAKRLARPLAGRGPCDRSPGGRRSSWNAQGFPRVPGRRRRRPRSAGQGCNAARDLAVERAGFGQVGASGGKPHRRGLGPGGGRRRAAQVAAPRRRGHDRQRCPPDRPQPTLRMLPSPGPPAVFRALHDGMRGSARHRPQAGGARTRRRRDRGRCRPGDVPGRTCHGPRPEAGHPHCRLRRYPAWPDRDEAAQLATSRLSP